MGQQGRTYRIGVIDVIFFSPRQKILTSRRTEKIANLSLSWYAKQKNWNIFFYRETRGRHGKKKKKKEWKENSRGGKMGKKKRKKEKKKKKKEKNPSQFYYH